MPYFRTMGELPVKRRSRFPDGKSGFYSEELIGEGGFYSDLSHVYYRHPPTLIDGADRITDIDTVDASENWPLLPRHFVTGQLKDRGDLILGRQALLVNDDVTIGFAVATETSELYRDANGDQCVYISSGSATLRSLFGELAVKTGDYVVIPAGVTHQWVLADDEVRALVIESNGHIKPPRRYLSAAGQFLEMAPYRERDLRGPQHLPEPVDGPADVIAKRGPRLSRMHYLHHPFDVVGWDGCLYPYALSIHDFEPIIGRFHQPPPVQQTFEAPGIVICSFCPRPPDFDPDAVGRPANHANVDCDEVMYYAGNYDARRDSGIGAGSISLHPSGFSHGPQVPAGAPKPSVAMLDELAVMIDTFKPLRISAAAEGVEDPGYPASWARAAAQESKS